MRFSNQLPIFTQIADMLEDQVVGGQLVSGDRLPSARELAASLEVNPNTAARALQIVAERGLASPERGTGYFVVAGAAELARAARRQRFFDDTLPSLFKTMDELSIGPEEISRRYRERAKEKSNAKQH